MAFKLNSAWVESPLTNSVYLRLEDKNSSTPVHTVSSSNIKKVAKKFPYIK